MSYNNDRKDDHYIEEAWGTITKQKAEAFYGDHFDANYDFGKGCMKIPLKNFCVGIGIEETAQNICQSCTRVKGNWCGIVQIGCSLTK